MSIPRQALFAAALLLSGCAGIGGGRRAGDVHDPYSRLASAISSAGENLSNRKVAVLPFSYTDGRESHAGVVISERLLTRIASGRRLEVVERGLLYRVLAELRFQRSGAVEEGSIKGLAKVLGVEAVVTGTLTARDDGRVEINVRLIRTESAAILAAASEAVAPDWGETPDRSPAAPGQLAEAAAPPPAFPFNRNRCPRGMVAYWSFDALRGAEAVDQVGGLHGRLSGGFRQAVGKAGAALDLDRSGNFFIADRPELRLRSAITIEAWLNYRSIDFSESGSKILCRGRSYCFVIGGAEQHSSRLLADMAGLSDPGPFQGSAVLQPGAWYHAALTYDGARIKIYLNGREDVSFRASGPLQPGNRELRMGNSPEAVAGYNAPFDGLLDEVALYDRALLPGEIAAHYWGGLAGRGYCAI